MGLRDLLKRKKKEKQEERIDPVEIVRQNPEKTCVVCGDGRNEHGKLTKYAGHHWHRACLRKTKKEARKELP